MFKKDDSSSILKGILIAVGAIVTIAGIAAVLYALFKKYFRITFECGDCESCESPCDSGSCEELEPEVCYADEPAADTADDAPEATEA